jgi:TatD DNase family protein
MLQRTHTHFRAIDIGANLTDPMFQGEYNGKKEHEADLSLVLERAWEVCDTEQ